MPDGPVYGVDPVAPGRASRLIFTYHCRTQRDQFVLLDIFDDTPEPDAFEFDTCQSSDGSTCHAYYVFPQAESRLPLDRGEFEFSVPLETTASIDENLPLTVEGVSTHAEGGTVTVSYPECPFLNFEADFD